MNNPTPLPLDSNNAAEAARILAAFVKPFDESEVKLKPAMVKGTRCLALAYIDSRCVMDRLDEAVGVNGWKDEYTVLDGGKEVECRLSVKIAGEWITKADVGGESEQPDGGDRMKAAYSDALKRAAVKFGIGRFLYRRPQTWMDYDPVKKQIVRGPVQQQKPAAKPQQAPQQQAKPQPSAWAAELTRKLANAKSRAEGVPLWNEFDAKVKNKEVSDTDKKALDEAFAEFGKKFPAPQTTGAK